MIGGTTRPCLRKLRSARRTASNSDRSGWSVYGVVRVPSPSRAGGAIDEHRMATHEIDLQLRVCVTYAHIVDQHLGCSSHGEHAPAASQWGSTSALRGSHARSGHGLWTCRQPAISVVSVTTLKAAIKRCSQDNTRKDAIGLCQNRRALTVPKIDAGVNDNYTPSSNEIDEALLHRKAMKALLRHGDTTRLDPAFKNHCRHSHSAAAAFCSHRRCRTGYCAASSTRPMFRAWSIA